MPVVIKRNYSRHHDKLTETEFTPVLENGLWIGAAQVSEEKAKEFDNRYGFQVITDAEYRDILMPPVVYVEPKPSETGEPLTDVSAAAGLDGGPEPPESK